MAYTPEYGSEGVHGGGQMGGGRFGGCCPASSVLWSSLADSDHSFNALPAAPTRTAIPRTLDMDDTRLRW